MDIEKYELMESAKEYCPKLIHGIKREIENHRCGTIWDSSNILLISEGMQFLLKALSTSTNKPNQEDYNRALEYLNDLAVAVQDNDNVSITDILEYELLPFVQELSETLNRIKL